MGGESKEQKKASKMQKQAAKQQAAFAQEGATYARQLSALEKTAGVQALGQEGLTTAEQQAMDFINMGDTRARQTIEQQVREQATSRGLFSSGSAIATEAAGIADLDLERARRQADLRLGAQNRMFQGLQLRQGLLSNAGGILSGAGQISQGVGQIGANLYGQATQQGQKTTSALTTAALGIGTIMTGGAMAPMFAASAANTAQAYSR